MSGAGYRIAGEGIAKLRVTGFWISQIRSGTYVSIEPSLRPGHEPARGEQRGMLEQAREFWIGLEPARVQARAFELT